MEIQRTGRYTHTYLGRRFYALNAYASDIYIEDIAHALSLMNRYNGHTPQGPYSVAQHSIYVSLECDPKDALWGLLHDASEAYIADLVSPVKAQIPQYRDIEDGLMKVICERFCLAPEMPESVRLADSTVLSAEVRDLGFPNPFEEWHLPHRPAKRRIRPMWWRLTKLLFTMRFRELTGQKKWWQPSVKWLMKWL